MRLFSEVLYFFNASKQTSCFGLPTKTVPDEKVGTLKQKGCRAVALIDPFIFQKLPHCDLLLSVVNLVSLRLGVQTFNTQIPAFIYFSNLTQARKLKQENSLPRDEDHQQPNRTRDHCLRMKINSKSTRYEHPKFLMNLAKNTT